MGFVVALGYSLGVALLWLPLALMLHSFSAERRGLEHVMAGVLLATIWPVSTPLVAGLFGVRKLVGRSASEHLRMALVRG